MAINKSMRRVLKALSFDGIEVEASRHLANLKAIDPMKIFYKTIDYKIYNGDHQIPVRIFLPGEKMEDDLPALLFFHGGGWVTESIDNYERICARLASATNHIVVSVEYRLAPEYPFPTGFYDCYMAAKAMFTNRFTFEYRSGQDHFDRGQRRRESGSSCFTDGKRSGRISAKETDSDLSGSE